VAERPGEGVNRTNYEPVTTNTTRVAGGRTSVSAPLGLGPETTERRGRQTTWIGSGPSCRGASESDPAAATRWACARCVTPRNRADLSPSLRPSPAATWALLTGGRFAGEGARRGGAAGLAADLVHQPTRGRWGLEVGSGAGDRVGRFGADCGCLGAHRIDCWRTSAQRSGHGGPPPRDPGSGPRRTAVFGRKPSGRLLADPYRLAARRHGCPRTNTQRTSVSAPTAFSCPTPPPVRHSAVSTASPRSAAVVCDLGSLCNHRFPPPNSRRISCTAPCRDL